MARVAAHDRRQQLIEAAIRVAERDGIAATTTRRIATEAGASLATVHYCFRSKQELFEQVLTAIITELSEAAQADIRPGRDAATLCAKDARTVGRRREGARKTATDLRTHALRAASAGYGELRAMAVRDLLRRLHGAPGRGRRRSWNRLVDPDAGPHPDADDGDRRSGARLAR
ncbi:MAG: TetR family transcriptional regulator [Geodermatophilaceae bacterium]|nr:TetR family transcriptional regulator [Geodermatophilaceae bacterium]